MIVGAWYLTTLTYWWRMDRLMAFKTELLLVISVEMLNYCVKSRSASVPIITSLVTFTRIGADKRSVRLCLWMLQLVISATSQIIHLTSLISFWQKRWRKEQESWEKRVWKRSAKQIKKLELNAFRQQLSIEWSTQRNLKSLRAMLKKYHNINKT